MQVDLFVNPSPKELEESSYKSTARKGEREIGIWIDGEKVYTFDRYGFLHNEAAEHIDFVDEPISLYVTYWKQGIMPYEAYIMVTDATRHSKWHHNPELYNFLIEHSELNRLFKIEEISYYDESIVGNWAELNDEN